jgi:hypothetical protein
LDDSGVCTVEYHGTLFVPTERNTKLTLEITLHEPSLGLVHIPVIPFLLDLAERASSVIESFDN